MNAFSDINDILTGFFDTLPWLVLMGNEQGYVTFVNREMRGMRSNAAIVGDTRLPSMFSDYFAALDGALPWLTPGETTVTRQEHGSTVTQHIWLRRMPLGGCLFIAIQPLSGTGDLRDAQLARLASLGFIVAGVCHEVANPLTAINSTVQLLRPSPSCTPVLLEKGLANIDADSQPRRDNRAAKRFFRKLLKGLRYVPRVIITSKLGSYATAKKELLPSVEHRLDRWPNNRAENSHESTREREPRMRGFKSPRHAQRFRSIVGVIASFFRRGRHLLAAVNYCEIKRRRFMQWCEIACLQPAI